jgi:hypothetical protein
LVSVVVGAGVEAVVVVRDYASSSLVVDCPAHHSPVLSSSHLLAGEEEAILVQPHLLDYYSIARDHSAELRCN